MALAQLASKARETSLCKVNSVHLHQALSFRINTQIEWPELMDAISKHKMAITQKERKTREAWTLKIEEMLSTTLLELWVVSKLSLTPAYRTPWPISTKPELVILSESADLLLEILIVLLLKVEISDRTCFPSFLIKTLMVHHPEFNHTNVSISRPLSLQKWNLVEYSNRVHLAYPRV